MVRIILTLAVALGVGALTVSHAQQIQQVMAGDTSGEAQTWSAMQAHMDSVADALAGAIARQFPDKAS